MRNAFWVLFFLSLASSAYGAQPLLVSREAPPGFPRPVEIVALKVETEPEIDGRGDDLVWSRATPITLRLKGGSGEIPLMLRAIRTEDRIFFLVEWPDPTEDRAHRPWIWDEKSQRYHEGEALEDALVFRFETGCRWVPELDAGLENESDVWIWRAARTDPVGYADDMWLILMEVPSPSRDYRGSKRLPVSSPDPRWRLRVNRDGSLDYTLEQPEPEMWYTHYGDLGTPSFRRQDPPAKYEGDMVLQFVPEVPTGSASDVKAKGVWEKGRWTVELGRTLKTQIDGSWQDVDFTWRNGVTLLSLAVFDHQEGIYDYAEGPGPMTSGLILLTLAP